MIDFVWRPAREYSPHIETSPLPVRGCWFRAHARRLRPLSEDGCLSCRTCCGVGRTFLAVSSEGPQYLAASYDRLGVLRTCSYPDFPGTPFQEEGHNPSKRGTCSFAPITRWTACCPPGMSGAIRLIVDFFCRGIPLGFRVQGSGIGTLWTWENAVRPVSWEPFPWRTLGLGALVHCEKWLAPLVSFEQGEVCFTHFLSLLYRFSFYYVLDQSWLPRHQIVLYRVLD